MTTSHISVPESNIPLTTTLLVSSIVAEQCIGEQKKALSDLWCIRKIELIVVGQCSMMSEMSRGLGLCVHRHSPLDLKGLSALWWLQKGAV